MGNPKKDLTGQHFGQLEVIGYDSNSRWKCKCSCGNETIVRTAALNSGKTKSCGCLRGQNTIGNTRNMGPKEDLTGKTFGYLTPMYYIKGGKWHCKCQCGNEIDVDTRNLNSNHTKSCGCATGKIIGEQLTIDMSGFENEHIKVLEKAEPKNSQARWLCLCKHCGRQFITRGTHIREGVVNSCGCSHSFNERKITKMFLDNQIEFATQYTFPDLKGKNNKTALRFDFAVFYNGQLSHLIEYNGKQHYEKSEGKWGEKFEILVENDQKKIQYCKDHNIELRIIRYDQEYTLEDLI